MRAGTPFENPFATGGERAGQDFARGNGAGSGGGGGLVIAAIPIFLIVVSVGLPAIFLAFFATPFLLFMQRTDGQLPPFAPAFIAMAKELFVLLLVLIALNILIGFVPDALRGNALLRALHWVIMDLVTWWSGVDPRNGIAFRGLVMEPPGLHLRAASVMLLLAPPFLAMAYTLRLIAAHGAVGVGNAIGPVLLRCVVSVAAGVLLSLLTFAMLRTFGEALPTPPERYVPWMAGLFGSTALCGSVVLWLGGKIVTGGRMQGLFHSSVLALIIWGGFCAVAFYYFRVADPVIAPVMGYTDPGDYQAALLGYAALQLPGLFFATRIAGEGFRTVAAQLCFAAALAVVGNMTMLTLLLLWTH
ncbi:hypothetical protein VHN57_18030 [Sphingobium sp. WW5]|uniref:hypothetical protein n=1 Tax=unclassified Sphingobium TaxID=2611147 RepID=UPI003C15C041